MTNTSEVNNLPYEVKMDTDLAIAWIEDNHGNRVSTSQNIADLRDDCEKLNADKEASA